jgi:hypothetical protein
MKLMKIMISNVHKIGSKLFRKCVFGVGYIFSHLLVVLVGTLPVCSWTRIFQYLTLCKY